MLNGQTPTATEITRATDYGLEKVKREIMALGTTWRPLLVTDYKMTKVGVSQYDNPVDFEAYYSVEVMTGDHSGVLQAGTTGSATLAASEDIVKEDAEGNWLLITAGTGVNQARQIDDYNETTKVCTMASAYATAPATSDTYLVANEFTQLRHTPLSLYTRYKLPGTPGTPERFTVIPDELYGELALYPVPDVAYGLRRRYYADLRRMDLDTTANPLYAKILRRWAEIFIQGVFVWSLSQDDSRLTAEIQTYQNMLQMLAKTDLDGFKDVDIQKRLGKNG